MNLMHVKKSLVVFLCVFVSACDSNNQVQNSRKPEYPVADFIINRWSARAMSGESISDKDLYSLFEAARWAPSEYNNQPWRFIYAKRGTEHWNKLFNLLVDFNKEWAKNAAVLMVIVSKNTLENGEPSISHSFDTGAAFQNLMLQASKNGLVSHGMGGFDHEQAKKDLKIPDGYTVEAMCAIGKPGQTKNLPVYMQPQEKPSDRKKVAEFVRVGSF